MHEGYVCVCVCVYTVAKYSAPVLADGGSIVFMSGALSRRPGK